MAKKDTPSQGPQRDLARAASVLMRRCQKIWIPMLNEKISALQARVQEKQLPPGSGGG